ncbi:MAG: hypothetical protein IT329_01815 [Caldilineaceae bacterium]|nr:hypothetical protein [Caldilineaceae bacterium]
MQQHEKLLSDLVAKIKESPRSNSFETRSSWLGNMSDNCRRDEHDKDTDLWNIVRHLDWLGQSVETGEYALLVFVERIAAEADKFETGTELRKIREELKRNYAISRQFIGNPAGGTDTKEKGGSKILAAKPTRFDSFRIEPKQKRRLDATKDEEVWKKEIDERKKRISELSALIKFAKREVVEVEALIKKYEAAYECMKAYVTASDLLHDYVEWCDEYELKKERFPHQYLVSLRRIARDVDEARKQDQLENWIEGLEMLDPAKRSAAHKTYLQQAEIDARTVMQVGAEYEMQELKKALEALKTAVDRLVRSWTEARQCLRKQIEERITALNIGLTVKPS